MTSVDAISAAGAAIPSFLILTVKVLLEEYVMADIDENVVITYTATGFNNGHRARQWLRHFNYHSFNASEDFNGYSIESWFGYGIDITKGDWNTLIFGLATKKK